LKTINVLVGPNNAGKSTVLDAFRAAAAAHSFARRRVPAVLEVGGAALFGYDIPVSNFPISLANIHTDYLTDEETSITFTLDNRNTFKLLFYENARCIMTTDSDGPRAVQRSL
jgi:recombinational DNA repair ATPase RecF